MDTMAQIGILPRSRVKDFSVRHVRSHMFPKATEVRPFLPIIDEIRFFWALIRVRECGTFRFQTVFRRSKIEIMDQGLSGRPANPSPWAQPRSRRKVSPDFPRTA
jgi:hypothetical protein